jgi:hypothetical protein
VTVDGLDQMQQVSRFLWLPWLRGRVRAQASSAHGDVDYWEGEHDGYRRLRPPVIHRRAMVRLGDAAWLVADRLESTGSHRYRLHWLMPDAPFEWDADELRLALELSAGSYHMAFVTSNPAEDCSFARAEDGSARGWRSPSYFLLEPALSLSLGLRAASTWFWTIFSTERCRTEHRGDALCLEGQRWSARISCPKSPEAPRLCASIAFRTESGESMLISE